jgi:alpha-tubulin suppressor-like RCC1 family protein
MSAVVVAIGALAALGPTLAPAGATENPATTMQPLMSPGGQHTCAIVGDAAKCWGNNVRGQLGRTEIATST